MNLLKLFLQPQKILTPDPETLDRKNSALDNNKYDFNSSSRRKVCNIGS